MTGFVGKKKSFLPGRGSLLGEIENAVGAKAATPKANLHGLLHACQELLVDINEFMLRSLPRESDIRFAISAASVVAGVLLVPLTGGWSVIVSGIGFIDWLGRPGPAVRAENLLRRFSVVKQRLHEARQRLRERLDRQ